MDLLKKIVICVGLVLPIAAYAEVFIPMPESSSLTLGSGVNILRPQEGLPSCFKVTPKPMDPAGLSYKISINVATSVEEVNRIRKKGASVSASYSGVSAKLQAWQNNSSTDTKSSLYLVIEARYVGARIEATQMVPAENRVDLFKNGSPSAILKQCGSHVAMVEHRGQTLRVVLDMKEASESTKQEIGAKFSAKVKSGMFKASASGNYMSSVEKLAKERKIDVTIEGSGARPSVDKVLDIIGKENKGDLQAVANALGVLIQNTGKESTDVGYALTLQPLYLYVDRAAETLTDESSVRGMDSIMDMLSILDAEKRDLIDQSLVNGIKAEEKARLKVEIEKISALHKSARSASIDCISKSNAEVSCEDQAAVLVAKISDNRKMKAEFVAEPGVGVYLKSTMPSKSYAVISGNFDGEEIMLDSFVLRKGEQQLPVFAKKSLAPPEPNIPIIGQLPTQNGQKEFITALPLLVSAGFVTSVVGEIPDDLIAKIYFGCAGFEVVSATKKIATGNFTIDQTKFAPGSICKTPDMGFWIGPPLNAFGPFNAPLIEPVHLMPSPYSPAMVPSIKNPVRVTMTVVDEYGFSAKILLTSNLKTEFATLEELMK